MKDSYYLASDIVAEPLIGKWYAWSFLVSPTTTGLYFKNLHLKLMQSYVRSPDLHHRAARDKNMRGGLFMNCNEAPDRVAELIESTTKDFAAQLELANDIELLLKTIEEKADGFALDHLYDVVPSSLKGLVELCYDMNNHVVVRFIEPLMYGTKYYDTSHQEVALSVFEHDDRPFVLGGPRFQNDTTVTLKTPFDSPLIDYLFSMRSTPRSLEPIIETVAPKDDDELAKLMRCFTKEPAMPERAESSAVAGSRIRYFGHATVLIESGGVSILTDPIVAYPNASSVDRYSYSDLPEFIDYVVLTHNHQDHVMLETLLQLRHKVGTIVVPGNTTGALQDPSLKLALRSVGFKDVRVLDEFDTIAFDGGEIVGLPFLGEHGDLNIESKLAYLFRTDERSVLCAADSNNLDSALYERIYQRYGKVDVLFIGMECEGAPMSWLYGPLFTTAIPRRMDQARRLNGSDFERASGIVDALKPDAVYVYAMGAEPWLTFISSIDYSDDSGPIVQSNKLIEYCHSKGIESERLFGKKEVPIA